jgi:hypothetical protein
MNDNNLSQEGMNVVPSDKEKLAGVLMYVLGYFGQVGFGIFAAFGLITNITDLPYFLRFHWTQAGRNGLLAIPIILFIIAPALIDSFVVKITNTTMYASFAIAGLFALWLIIIDIYAMYCASRGEMKQVLPGKMNIKI